MSERHISEELLARFLRSEASRQESRRIVRHLLSGCSHCSETARRLASKTGLFTSKESGKGDWQQSHEVTFTQALVFATKEEQKLARERLRGWAQWAELEPLAPYLRLARVKSDRRLHTIGLYERFSRPAAGAGRRSQRMPSRSSNSRSRLPSGSIQPRSMSSVSPISSRGPGRCSAMRNESRKIFRGPGSRSKRLGVSWKLEREIPWSEGDLSTSKPPI